jgi:hypothetical protein
MLFGTDPTADLDLIDRLSLFLVEHLERSPAHVKNQRSTLIFSQPSLSLFPETAAALYQEKTGDRHGGRDEKRVKSDQAGFSAVLDSELFLFDRFSLADLGAEVEYPAHSEAGTEVKCRLEKTGGTDRSR